MKNIYLVQTLNFIELIKDVLSEDEQVTCVFAVCADKETAFKIKKDVRDRWLHYAEKRLQKLIRVKAPKIIIENQRSIVKGLSTEDCKKWRNSSLGRLAVCKRPLVDNTLYINSDGF
jgi:hypothetical protein